MILSYVIETLEDRGRSAGSVPTSLVYDICKHAGDIRHVSFRPIADELRTETAHRDVIAEALSEDESSNICLYLAARACDQFYWCVLLSDMFFLCFIFTYFLSAHNRYPGTSHALLDSDFVELKAVALSLLSDLGLPPAALRDELLREFCRYGHVEVHSVSSLIGGVGAQEVVKLLTGLFAPVDNTFIYNGMKGTTSTFSL